MSGRTCTHGRPLSICAVCAPIADAAFRSADSTPIGIERLHIVLDALIERAALGDPGEMGELRRRRAASDVRRAMQLRFRTPATSEHLPMWLRWAFPLRNGLDVREGERAPEGWRWFREFGRDMAVAVPWWLHWWLVLSPEWRVLRWCYRHGLLQGPEGAMFSECRWRFAFTRKPYAWMPRFKEMNNG